MKLNKIAKNILSELRLHSGTMGNPSSISMLENSMAYRTQKRFEFLRKYLKTSLGISDSSDFTTEKLSVPIPQDLKQLIASNSDSSQGNLHVFKSTSKGFGSAKQSVVYYLVNLSASSIATMMVAQISTAIAANKAYSLKRLYGLDAAQVHFSEVAKEYNALGYAKFLYDTILYENQILESDNVLFEGSFNMWTKHFPKVSSFFGFIPSPDWSTKGGSARAYRNDNIVLPIESLDLTNKRFLEDYVVSFVAFAGPVPAELKKIKQLTKDVSFSNGTLGIHYGIFNQGLNSPYEDLKSDEVDDYKFKSFVDYLDTVPFDDFVTDENNDITFTKGISKLKKIILLLEDAQLIISKDSDGSIKYDFI